MRIEQALAKVKQYKTEVLAKNDLLPTFRPKFSYSKLATEFQGCVDYIKNGENAENFSKELLDGRTC